MTIKVKKLYDEFSLQDGFRIFVDTRWPLAMKKSKARIDLWFKEVAPSRPLRDWFKKNPNKWPGFQQKYKKELRNPENKKALRTLRLLIRDYETVTFLHALANTEENNAVILKQLLEQ